MSEQNYRFVNAHINNISFPKSIEQLENFIYEHGCYNVEDVIAEASDGYTIWTVPRSSVVGDIVLYAMGMKDIEWLVLEIQKDKALLISKFVLDCGMFNELEGEINWESCTLRGWLNNTFLESAFSEDEKSMILKSFVPASTDPNNDTNCSNSTNDKIFLLSVEEVLAYFNSPHEMIATPTDYAKFNGIFYSESTNTANWWLRTPGHFEKDKLYYSSYTIDENGECEAIWTMSSITGIRPAMWIDLKDFS